MNMSANWAIIDADAIGGLTVLPAYSAQACITSPPYWMQRDYGVVGEIGREASVEEYLGRLVAVFAEVLRVLREDGTLWVVVGDKYACGELLCLPHRLALALQDAGWRMIADIIWSKESYLPESVRRRPSQAHEHVLQLAKSRDFYADFRPLRQPAASRPHAPGGRKYATRQPERVWAADGKRNITNVWTLCPERRLAYHPAPFPTALAERILIASTRAGDLVIDPFVGSGTTGVVAIQHGRPFIGIDLNPEYCASARKRLLETDVKARPT
jgi:site-specific DNA-methyltransferase (adenine-specific)